MTPFCACLQVVKLSVQLASASNSEHACGELHAQLAAAREGRERLKAALGELRGKHREALAAAAERGSAASGAAALLLEKDALLDK